MVNMFTKIKNFLQEARLEFKRINWPNREETIRYTLFVIVFSLIMASFLGLFDYIFLYLLNNFIL